MSAVNFILSLARKILARESKGITTIPNQMAVEQKAGEIAATLQSAGLPLNRADEFIKSEQDLTRILNIIESTPPVMREVPSGIRNTKSAKVFDMEGKEIDPRSKIMGGKQSETEAEIVARLNEENRKTVSKIKDRQKMVDDAIDNMSPSLSGDTKIDAELVAEDMAERMGKVYDDLPQKERLDLYDQAYRGLIKKRFDSDDFAQGGRAGFKSGSFLFKGAKKLGKKYKGSTLEALLENPKLLGTELSYEGIMELLRMGGMMQDGGRAGFKDGMTRRTFLKLLGGMAAVPIVGKFFKLAKVGQKVKQVPMIKTDDVAGKPEWFDALVNKVIREGDDVTKKFATGERQSIHQKTLDDGSVVRVTEDVDDGAVRVEYDSPDNVFEDTVQMEYKKPLPDEGAPRPAAEFTTSESGPVGRQTGPDDYDIEVDEVGGTSIRDLDSDVSKLKEYATGKGPTMREILRNKKRRDKAKAITEGGDEMIDAVTRRQGDYDPFASGGVARLLGE